MNSNAKEKKAKKRVPARERAEAKRIREEAKRIRGEERTRFDYDSRWGGPEYNCEDCKQMMILRSQTLIDNKKGKLFGYDVDKWMSLHKFCMECRRNKNYFHTPKILQSPHSKDLPKMLPTGYFEKPPLANDLPVDEYKKIINEGKWFDGGRKRKGAKKRRKIKRKTKRRRKRRRIKRKTKRRRKIK